MAAFLAATWNFKLGFLGVTFGDYGLSACQGFSKGPSLMAKASTGPHLLINVPT